jgi:hypothetical protein
VLGEEKKKLVDRKPVFIDEGPLIRVEREGGPVSVS